MKVIYSPTFQKQYRRLEKAVKLLAENKEKVFRNNPFDQKLKTHKLHGKLAGLWSLSLNRKSRILFEFNDGSSVIFHAIGPHDIYE